MKIAFVSHQLRRGQSFGGAVVTHSNLAVLRRLGTVEPIAITTDPQSQADVQATRGPLDTAWHNLLGYSGLLNASAVRRCVARLKTLAPDVIWLDSSLYGRLLKAITRAMPATPVICFFHNVEHDFLRSRLAEGKWHYAVTFLSDWYNERLTTRLATSVVAMTAHDSRRLLELYGRSADAVVPVSLEDRASGLATIDPSAERDQVLFVGSVFGPNVEAAVYLSDVIAPLVSKTIVIVGRGFDALRSRLAKPNVLVFGEVQSLAPFYDRALLVAAPVFSGAGMKVKVAEALMYGRRVVASEQAGRGYESAIASGAVTIARTAQEFASVIETSPQRQDSVARTAYASHFSLEAATRSVRSMLQASVAAVPAHA